ncbi:MAG: hypothetical protein DRQ61_01800 [Gammaproteobacteria bacterium]|nr:MAG: hypothetical protein DRQ56_05065 [Gammaproteobacteria bacterium]RLA24171.1 MAG: hypothetical protein DRQ61_01800 [Gammaproteobacteria bacterium]
MKNCSRPIKKLIILTCLLLPSFSSYAAVTYKYPGEHGETVYSQTPPKDAQAERVITKSDHTKKPPRPSAVEVLEKFTRDEDDKQRAAQKAAEEEKASALKKQNCAAAEHNLTIYEGSPNRLVKDSSGNYKRLNEEERQAKIKDARKNIKAFCN